MKGMFTNNCPWHKDYKLFTVREYCLLVDWRKESHPRDE